MAIELVRSSLEVWHGHRVEFVQMDINPLTKPTQKRRVLEIQGKYRHRGINNTVALGDFCTTIELNCHRDRWEPHYTFIRLREPREAEAKSLSARWEWRKQLEVRDDWDDSKAQPSESAFVEQERLVVLIAPDPTLTQVNAGKAVYPTNYRVGLGYAKDERWEEPIHKKIA